MLTPAERTAFATGADFTELCAVQRREWEKTLYAKRKAKLQARYDAGGYRARGICNRDSGDCPGGREVTSDTMLKLSSKGGKKGGPARAKALTPQELRLIGIIAANKRWGKESLESIDVKLYYELLQVKKALLKRVELIDKYLGDEEIFLRKWKNLYDALP